MTDKSNIKNLKQNTQQAEDNPDEGRSFNFLSFNKDGSELMFNECFDANLINKNTKTNKRECRIFRLNLNDKTLKHYNFPDQDKYQYINGSFSPQGNFVTFIRVPKTDYSLSVEQYNETVRKNAQKAEIGIINADGSNFRIIKTREGLKGEPVMSNDETKIAYYRGSLRKPGGKTLSTDFDIWEIDLKNNTDKLFAGPHEFFEMAQIQYLEGDNEILIHGYGPKKYAKKISNYTRLYSNSSIYTIKRKEIELPEPLVIEGIKNSTTPSVSTFGNLFFYGEGLKEGLSIFRKTNKEINKWIAIGEFVQKIQILPSKNEEKVFFTYVIMNNSKFRRPDLSKKGIAFLDTTNAQWHKLNIPKASLSEPIPIRGLNIIEIKQNNTHNDSLKNYQIN